MRKGFGRMNAAAVIVFALIAIGLVIALLYRPMELLLPILIIGIVFLLYKFPPKASRGYAKTKPGPKPKPGGRTQKARPRSKTVPFRVIEGGKDDDDMPRYH